MSTPLTEQDVLVVGGASGIGRTVARAFADEGARVMIADLQEEPKSDGDPTHEVITAEGAMRRSSTSTFAIWHRSRQRSTRPSTSSAGSIRCSTARVP
ncbi:SDR family NAD(P)-dependent oxidoreductase [Natrialba swarupiae]|nr:SDR family NAD(P)-dependent oxidoreductase [Natrialba swarupiae]